MSQVIVQGKQQAMMRVAASRVSVLDAVVSTRSHATGCVKALPLSPASIARIGAVAGAAATLTGVVVGLMRKKKNAEKKVSRSSSVAGMLVPLVFQTLGPVLLPMLQRVMQQRMEASDAGAMGKGIKF